MRNIKSDELVCFLHLKKQSQGRSSVSRSHHVSASSVHTRDDADPDLPVPDPPAAAGRLRRLYSLLCVARSADRVSIRRIVSSFFVRVKGD